MSGIIQSSRAASTRRTALVAIGTFLGVLLAAALVLWLKLGSAVFFELIVAGIRYCF
jgi:hypothetical protein